MRHAHNVNQKEMAQNAWKRSERDIVAKNSLYRAYRRKTWLSDEWPLNNDEAYNK